MNTLFRWILLLCLVSAPPASADQIARQFQELVTRSVAGDADASLELARLFHIDGGTTQSFPTAAHYYDLAASQGLPEASEYADEVRAVQSRFIEGMRARNAANSDPARFKDAIDAFVDASSRGHHEATYRLGFLFYEGKGVEQDEEQAYELFERSASGGHASSMVMVGFMHLTGRGVERNTPGLAAMWYRAAADTGHPDGTLRLGLLHESGRGVDLDLMVARDLVERARELGHDDAERHLERITGKLTPPTPEANARDELREELEAKEQRLRAELEEKTERLESLNRDVAAARGNTLFREAVALYPEAGSDRSKLRTVIQKLKESADLGNTQAMLALFDLYESGKLVTRDAEYAKSQLYRAAAKGETEAFTWLHAFAAEGQRGFEADQVTSFVWGELGAARGARMLAYTTGLALITGDHVPTDIDQAERWLTRAGDVAEGRARQLLESIDLLRERASQPLTDADRRERDRKASVLKQTRERINAILRRHGD